MWTCLLRGSLASCFWGLCTGVVQGDSTSCGSSSLSDDDCCDLLEFLQDESWESVKYCPEKDENHSVCLIKQPSFNCQNNCTMCKRTKRLNFLPDPIKWNQMQTSTTWLKQQYWCFNLPSLNLPHSEFKLKLHWLSVMFRINYENINITDQSQRVLEPLRCVHIAVKGLSGLPTSVYSMSPDPILKCRPRICRL